DGDALDLGVERRAHDRAGQPGFAGVPQPQRAVVGGGHGDGPAAHAAERHAVDAPGELVAHADAGRRVRGEVPRPQRAVDAGRHGKGSLQPDGVHGLVVTAERAAARYAGDRVPQLHGAVAPTDDRDGLAVEYADGDGPHGVVLSDRRA